MDTVHGVPISMETVASIQPQQLAGMLMCKTAKFLIVDSRTFCEYNTSHILNSVNVWSSKIRKKRLQQNSISVFDYLHQASQASLQERCFNEVIVYEQNASCPSAVPTDSFIHVLLLKLKSAFDKVFLLAGGFLEFQSLYPELCEDSTQKLSPLTSLSQPCLPVTKSGPTRVLPFLFLGSQNDANNRQLLNELNISYELNVSTSCPKPEFLQDSHFMRIPVNDNFSEKLLPYFSEAFRFIDKVREAGGRVLVHCLAGISRSPTVAIAFVMKHLRLHYDEAYRYVKNRRPTISPNINFVGQLLELDRQLLGDGFLYRSPTAPFYLEYDFACSDLTPSIDSLVLKSSSSSCVESNRQKEFPYSLKRSLPSLRLEKALESGSLSTPGSPSSPSSAMASLSLFSALKGKDSSNGSYVSDRLPSSPVTPPYSPEFFSAYAISEEHGRKSAKMSTSASSSPEPIPTKIANINKADDKLILRRSYSAAEAVSRTTSYTSFINTPSGASFSTTASIEVNSPTVERDKALSQGTTASKQPVCILEVTHKSPPFTHIDVQDTEPMIIHETQIVATSVCDRRTPDSKVVAMDTESPETVSLPPPLASEENNNNAIFTPTDTTPPVFPKMCAVTSYLLKNSDSKPLPRSYSSSETHLNMRRLLENQNSSSIGQEICTRKSFSSDEVGRGFQPCQPSSPVAFTRDIVTMATTPSELARCDSWSTSGLGSEISDFDSLQEDSHSILTDDTLGPFDAVFADVFPGEFQDTVFNDSLKKLVTSSYIHGESDRHETKRSKSMNDTKQLRQLKRQTNLNEMEHRIVRATSSLNAPIQNKEPLSNPPTPRPVSLPGVRGTYITRLERPNSNSNSDMGVDMDDSPDWQREKGHDIFQFNHSKKGHMLSATAEHSSNRLLALGEGAKLKRELTTPEEKTVDNGKTTQHQDLFSRRLSREESGQHVENNPLPNRRSLFIKVKSRRGNNDCSSKSSSSSPPNTARPSSAICLISPSTLEDDKDKDKNKFAFDKKERKHSLEERWKSWDQELKKKIRNIQNNVSMASWDPDGDSVKDTSDAISGFHLAQEMMQSMEDLLETEISDIKRQATALSSKFGLHIRSPSNPAGSLETSPAIIDPKTHRGTVSFCPTLQQGIVRSGKSQNLNKTSLQFPTLVSQIDHHFEVNHSATSVRTKSDFQTTYLRAKSEPPLCMEEGLYRARSCPGIPQGQTGDLKESSCSKELFCVNLRSPKPPASNREPNRYSCGALDFIVPNLPSFESCPDISQLKPYFLENASPSSGASCSSSTHSSFNRLLQVS